MTADADRTRLVSATDDETRSFAAAGRGDQA